MTELSLSARLARLTPEQRAALAGRLHGAQPRGAAPSATAGPAPEARDDGTAPLSFAQEQIWFQEQFEPGTAYRNMSGVAHVPMPADAAVFADCLETLVARHEILRTRFVIRRGEPAGVVEDRVATTANMLPQLPEQERERLFLEDARRPFDVAAAPLLRMTVAPDGPDACFVQLTMHHLVSDGFSSSVLFRELGELYRMRSAGLYAQLPPLPFQFADYAAWERRCAADQSHADALDYWSGLLRGAPRQLTLPADHPRPARMTSRGARLPVDLPLDLVRDIKALSRRLGVTTFVTALTAYATVLGRYSAQDDLVIGVPVANREQRGVEQIIGPFLNTLALRFDLSGAPRFAALATRVHREFLTGLEHQAVPFERVLQAVQDSRDPARSPLFQAVFNFQTDQAAAAGIDGIDLRDLHNGGCAFDLLFNLSAADQAIDAHFDYYADVYDEPSIARLADSFRSVLRTACADPDVSVAELPLVPADQLAALCAAGTGPALAYDSTRLVHDLVLDRARTSPDRLAIIDHGTELTYAALAAQSAAVANALATHGAHPGARVAICLPRSADMIASILGTLRAGCCYIPLDPADPPERRAYVCQDAGIAAVLSRSDVHDALPPVDAPIIDTDALASGAATPNDMATEAGAAAERCAYMIYTSGSTGRPKGVQVSHRNLANLLASMQAQPGLGEHDVLLAVTSPSFDISLLEMLTPLVAGARVVVASPQDAVDGRSLAALLEAHGVTVMQATPATWQLMVESGWQGRVGLRALCGGEAFPPALAAALLDRVGEVWNMYGPTETTIWSAIHQVARADVERGDIPLGRPIANTTALVLDQGLNPVPVGVLGELWLGGDGVCLGYHARPELNSERFASVPVADGARMYRTGDLARTHADGILEFAGRTDHQVKIRGFRIELGEIETVLGAHPLVARAVAVARPDETGTHAINAYVEPANAVADPVSAARGPVASDLLEFAAQRLPHYMLPARITVLDALPLLPNGKIDRNALPKPDQCADTASAQQGEVRDRVAPSTPTESALAELWQELLELPEVGVRDGFFELGGHSLLATKLMFRIREVFGVDLPLQALFEGEPTIARLAELLDEGADTSGPPDADLDLQAEARLADDIRPAPGAHVHSVRHPQHVLFTGATGFVGAFLVAELLRTTHATVFCLVRAGSAAQGLERIKAAMSEYGVWDEAAAERIIPVPGALDRPSLGLSRPMWQHLAATVDVIHHCGAEVNFLQPYAALKAANVLGTTEILRLACDGAVKPVHFMSTIYVFSRFAYPPNTEFYEDMDPIHTPENTFGYTQSKWVSEQMVLEAGRRGVPVYVYRAGRMAGDSRTGACQTYDFVWQVTKVGIEMGSAPVMDMTLDVTPVDYAARALIHLSRQPELAGRAFHLLSPKQITEKEYVCWLEHYGYPAAPTTFGDWCARVVRRAAELSDRTAGALAPFLSGTLPLDRMPPAHFDQSNVEQGLAGSGIACPTFDEELLHTYLDYFRAIDYLPEPERETAAASAGGARPSGEETP